jgi:hypothetical protein
MDGWFGVGRVTPKLVGLVVHALRASCFWDFIWDFIVRSTRDLTNSS